jgi:hypothetical protein
MRMLEHIDSTITEAKALKLKGLPRKYKNKKKYALEAVLYRDQQHFDANHSKMSGLTDLVDLEDALKSAKPGMVLDVYVYELEDNEFDPDDPFRELIDTIQVKVG